jgi:hypothetical protein
MFTNKLTQDDILEMLPIPPVGTAWKIWVGRRYINKKEIDYNGNQETYPFVLGLITNDNNGDDTLLARKGMARLTKRTIKLTAIANLKSALDAYPVYSNVQTEHSKVNKNSHLMGYYASKNELTH